MKATVPIVSLLLAVATPAVAAAETVPDPVSGSWGTDERTFLELKLEEEGQLSGSALWPREGQLARLPLHTATFDRSTGRLKVAGAARKPDGGAADYVIDGHIEGDTLSATFVFDGWQPRPLQLRRFTGRTPEQRRALHEQHKGDFDYLLGDWEFTARVATPRLRPAAAKDRP